MTRSVYVTGIGRGDGRQVVELGVMELLTRTVDRVGVFVPLRHPGPDHLFDLLRARYRLTQDPATARGLEYAEAAALEAGHGTDELVSRLVDRYQAVAAEHEVVLVLGSDYRDTQLPAELDLNARLANEFGAPVLPVVGGRRQSAASVADEVHNTYRAFSALGCDIVAVIANRVDPGEVAAAAGAVAGRLPVPVYVLPEEPLIAAPTVAQVVRALDGEVLLGDEAGLARNVLDFVFGGATLPTFLAALTEGCLVITPGDRADLIIAAQRETGGDPSADVDTLVYDAGRPVLVVPHAGPLITTFKRVLLAWNGSKEAARAAFDALPFIIEAEKTDILVIDPPDTLDEIP